MSARLADIPKIKKLKADIESFEQFIGMCKNPFVGTLFKGMGADIDKVIAMEDRIVEMKRQIEKYESLPDRFNEQFADRGWIMHELIDFDIAESAVEHAENGDVDGAEAILIDYYNPDTVEQLLNKFILVKAYADRKRLLLLALQDYRDERYHACIPIVLMMLDGLILDVHEENQGLFVKQEDDAKIEAYDSFSAHNQGFRKVFHILCQGRRKTTTESLTLPYRNGILHGTDLGYDNRIVAAKTWAAFLSVHDFTFKAEKGKLHEPPPKPRKTLAELIQQNQSLKDFDKYLEEWKPRTVVVGEDIPLSGIPEDFEDSTPERKAVEFLHWWSKRNYGHMARCLDKRVWKPDSAILKMRKRFSKKELKAFSLVSVVDEAAASSTVQASIQYVERERLCSCLLTIRLSYEDQEGKPRIRNVQEGEWYIGIWEESDHEYSRYLKGDTP